jgi:methylase of polypeptide subunit release factors
MMKDVLGDAISDYFHKRTGAKLWVNNKYGPKEEMPVDTYFRTPDDMPELEWVALQQCRGKVLDIGAGAGSHTLALQEMGLDITALDISPKAAAIMKDRGVKNILLKDFFTLRPEAGRYDSLLLLMNGIGLAGTLDGLRTFLDQAKDLLLPGGQLIFDSSDIAYLYDGKTPKPKDYYGEILYQYEYRKQRSDWFKWLFIDRNTLAGILTEKGWRMGLLFEDEFDQYLVNCKPV